MLEVFTFHLVRPAGFPVPFSTFVPEDMRATTAVDGAGHALRVVAEFGGDRDEDAFLEALFLPQGESEAEARANARGFAEERGPVERRPDVGPRFPWSLAEHDFMRRQPDGSGVLGTVALGERGGRFFRLVLHYPEEYAEGFGPRANRVLEDWRWEDTGDVLGGAPAPDQGGS